MIRTQAQPRLVIGSVFDIVDSDIANHVTGRGVVTGIVNSHIYKVKWLSAHYRVSLLPVWDTHRLPEIIVLHQSIEDGEVIYD